MRDQKGRFTKGSNPSPNTQFKKGEHRSPETEFKGGSPSWNKGKKLSLEHREKLKKSWKYDKHFNEEIKEKLSRSMMGKNTWSKGRKLTEEHIKKFLSRRDKSSLEIKFEEIIKSLGLPYKFVGNGEVIVARKCPDFVNSKGEKIAVEVYYRKHKNLFRNGLDEWKAERTKIFNKEGWEIIFFDETEINNNSVINKLKGGN